MDIVELALDVRRSRRRTGDVDGGVTSDSDHRVCRMGGAGRPDKEPNDLATILRLRAEP